MSSLRVWNPIRADRPIPHYSAGRNLYPQRYIVGWPDGIVKVGSTDHGRRRWGAFLARGGVMIDLAYYGPLIEALEGEIWMQERLDERFARAFENRKDATRYLGNNGAGYLECYVIDPALWPEIAELARSM